MAVGLTGGIGAGKSTALALFADLGADTFSADAEVHASTPARARRQIAAHFGPDVLDERRRWIGRGSRKPCEGDRRSCLGWRHSCILRRRGIERPIETASAGTVVVCEVPLLFEAGYEDLFDLVVTVEAGGRIDVGAPSMRFGLEQFTELEGLQAAVREGWQGATSPSTMTET